MNKFYANMHIVNTQLNHLTNEKSYKTSALF
jgi:hypothetical protein